MDSSTPSEIHHLTNVFNITRLIRIADGWIIPYKPGTAETDQVNKSLLICDSFGAHHTDRAIQKAQELNIDIILIPPGATDECQPLDCRIFGIIKARGRKELNEH